MRTYAPYAVMILVQVLYGGSNIIVKLALDTGLNQLPFMVYRHLLAMAVLAPFAYVLERKQRPPLSFSLIAKIFVIGSLGTTIHINVYYIGLTYTSATVASALSNAIPSLTFLMAVLIGMEKVNISSARGRAKVLGTVICITGSLVFTFWKGGYLLKSFEETPLINLHSNKGPSSSSKENWIKGSLIILTSHVSWTAYLILQAVIYKVYPARLSLNVLISFFASVQNSTLALFFTRNPSAWLLDGNMQLCTLIYCGVVISGLVYYLQTWCISKKGPVFTSMFSPLLLVIVGLFSAIAFAERLHLGSLIGAALVIMGLYIVLWGKAQDVVTTSVAACQPDQGKVSQVADCKSIKISINDRDQSLAVDQTCHQGTEMK